MDGRTAQPVRAKDFNVEENIEGDPAAESGWGGCEKREGEKRGEGRKPILASPQIARPFIYCHEYQFPKRQILPGPSPDSGHRQRPPRTGWANIRYFAFGVAQTRILNLMEYSGKTHGRCPQR